MKYLIVGLGNIGKDYENTRHNIGFKVVERLAEQKDATFKDDNLAMVTEIKHKSRTYILVKPNTYMNLSGKAVRFWMQKNDIPKENLLVILDDLALTFGALRLRGKGSDGGHNGLKNIDLLLGHNQYARLRLGIGNEFGKGQQVDYVLGKWNTHEKAGLDDFIDRAAAAALDFGAIGLTFTMSAHNSK
jgi:peptidyl-tRNA hydrolase, PTH1 family